MTTMTVPATADVASSSSRVLAGCGVGGAAAYVAAAVLFGEALGGADNAEAAAQALGDAAGRTQGAVLLLTVAVLLLSRVVAELGVRVVADRPASRLVVPLGVSHLVLLAAGFWSLAGAISVGQNIFDSGVSAVGAEVALVGLNTFSPLSGFLAAGFLVATAFAGKGLLPKWIHVSALVLAVLLVPPMTGWAALYLVPLWLGTVAVSLARR